MRIVKLTICTLLLITQVYTSEGFGHHIDNARENKKRGQHSQAVKHYQYAIAEQPNNANLLLELALLQVQLGNYIPSLELHNSILKLHPNNSDILRNKGFILKKMQRYDEAITCYQKILEKKPHDSRAQRGISHAYLITGDFQNGWPSYEYRWVEPPAYVQQFKNYVQAHNDLHGKTVLLKTEYGLGDTMQFIRYAELIKMMGATVVVESQKPLVNMLSHCPFIDIVVPAGTQVEPIDFTCLLMSLPLVFETTIKTIPHKVPYLYSDKDIFQFWKKKLDNQKFNIGICWQADTHKGSTNETVKKDSENKSIPLEILAQLSQIPGVQLYSLQKIDGTEQLKNLPKQFDVKNFGPDFDNSNGAFMDTAAVMCSLDLVITIDTSVAHLAGGLGVPVWVLLPHKADWRWLLARDDSPWYPTMKLFRQQEPGSWQQMIETVKDKLIHYIDR